MAARVRGNLRLGFFCLAVAALSTGCATLQENLDQTKMAWQGATYDEVVARWGKPVRTETRPDGAEAHTWISEGPVYRPYGPSVGVGVGVGSGGGGVGLGMSFPFGGSAGPTPRCERTLVFRDGKVIEQAWSGPDDYCVNFTRA